MTWRLPEGRNDVVHGLEVSLELEAVDETAVVAGEPRQGILALGLLGSTQDAAPIEAGIWELRAGTVTDVEAEEIFIVLSGGATIELLKVPEGRSGQQGQRFKVKPGDVMRLAAGTRTRWTVPDHIRKVYITAG